MDKTKIATETFKLLSELAPIIRDLLAAGRTPEEVIAHVAALGPAARLDAEAVALDEARKIREES